MKINLQKNMLDACNFGRAFKLWINLAKSVEREKLSNYFHLQKRRKIFIKKRFFDILVKTHNIFRIFQTSPKCGLLYESHQKIMGVLVFVSANQNSNKKKGYWYHIRKHIYGFGEFLGKVKTLGTENYGFAYVLITPWFQEVRYVKARGESDSFDTHDKF